MAQEAACTTAGQAGDGDGEEEVFLPSVEMKGLFTYSSDYGLTFITPDALMSSSYLPRSCRIYSKNKKEPWLMVQGWDLRMTRANLLPPSEFTPGKLPPFYSELQPKLQRILGNLVFQGGKWTQTNEIEVSNDLERNLSMGFVNGMGNGRGRQLVCSLLEELRKDICPDKGRAIGILNLGGGSRKEAYQIRNVYFSLLYGIHNSDPSKLSSSSPDDQPEDKSSGNVSSESGRAGGDHQLRPVKRKHYDIEEFDNDVSQLDAKNRLWRKSLVPDVVCEAYFRKAYMSVQSVVLTVSVKSSMGLPNDKDLNQLKCEMMPVVMKQKQALGLIICPTEAMLVRMVYTEENNTKQIVVFHSFPYQFISGDGALNFAEFDKMCLNVIHYSNLVVQQF